MTTPFPDPTKPTRDSAADYNDVFTLQKRLVESADTLESMCAEVAEARHVREYDGDRRRRALAVAALPLVQAGASHAASETEAKASAGYGNALATLGRQLVAAEEVMAKWEAAKIQWETARSLLSMSREQIKGL